jgi:GT2 family glycosyltransferase
VSAERVVVVLVNYNSADHLQACLAALAAQTLEHRTLVVDNASRDGSARSAHVAFPNVGFIT